MGYLIASVAATQQNCNQREVLRVYSLFLAFVPPRPQIK